MTTDITLILPDRVGALAFAFASLSRAGIEFHGCAGFPAWAGEGILHVLVDDVEAARAALATDGIVIREERELLITGQLGDGAELTRTLERVAAAGVSIDLIYQLRDGRVALGVNRLDVARRAIDAPAATSATATGAGPARQG
jgi:hypothetical protein